LKGERVSPIKYEYRQGQVWAMAGGTQVHLEITFAAKSFPITAPLKRYENTQWSVAIAPKLNATASTIAPVGNSKVMTKANGLLLKTSIYK
jgi:hypothetical protein